MAIKSEIQIRIQQFLESCPSGYDFPMGGLIQIPLQSEHNLVHSIESTGRIVSSDVNCVRGELSIREAYCLVIFAVRMAILGVRSNAPQLLKAGVVGVVVDDGLVDWRDLLGALAILEDCSIRLGVDFISELREILELATDQRRKDINEKYLSRPAEMRGVDVMGFSAKGNRTTLYYCPSNDN